MVIILGQIDTAIVAYSGAVSCSPLLDLPGEFIQWGHVVQSSDRGRARELYKFYELDVTIERCHLAWQGEDHGPTCDGDEQSSVLKADRAPGPVGATTLRFPGGVAAATREFAVPVDPTVLKTLSVRLATVRNLVE